jgi:hypothetical protein
MKVITAQVARITAIKEIVTNVITEIEIVNPTIAATNLNAMITNIAINITTTQDIKSKNTEELNMKAIEEMTMSTTNVVDQQVVTGPLSLPTGLR